MHLASARDRAPAGVGQLVAAVGEPSVHGATARRSVLMLATLWVPSENHDVDVSQLTRKARLASVRVVQTAASYQSSFPDTSSLGGTESAERGFVPQDALPEASAAARPRASGPRSTKRRRHVLQPSGSQWSPR